MLDSRWPFARRRLTARSIDVLCLGHALVDRFAHAGFDEVGAAGLEVGRMLLVDAARAREIGGRLPEGAWEQVAGGSAANTAVGVASLGGTPGFAGAVGEDSLGAWYARDLERAGVRCAVPAVTNGGSTGVCHILISPGGERSMGTSLGAAGELSLSTVEQIGPSHAEVLYLEGYLLDPPLASAAVAGALVMAGDASTLVSLSLSDPFVVDRHGDSIRQLVESGAVDLLFGNEEEVRGLTGARTRAEWTARLRRPGAVAVVTRGADGAVAILPDGEIEVPAESVGAVVDTTGAGDLFAAGCLYGLTHSLSPVESLRLGSFAAAEIISHLGARPERRLSEAAGSLLRPG